MKDMNHTEALTKAHQCLADDLASVSQLIEPVNDRALAMLYRAQRRLQDIEELVKHATKPAADIDDDKLPGGFVQSHPGDTLAHVADVLAVLQQIDHATPLNESARIGHLLILEGAIAALTFEARRAETVRKAS